MAGMRVTTVRPEPSMSLRAVGSVGDRTGGSDHPVQIDVEAADEQELRQLGSDVPPRYDAVPALPRSCCHGVKRRTPGVDAHLLESSRDGHR
jgi:hypothetical protein